MLPSSTPSQRGEHEPADRGEIVAALLHDDGRQAERAEQAPRLRESPRAVTSSGLSGSAAAASTPSATHERLGTERPRARRRASPTAREPVVVAGPGRQRRR